VICYQEPEEKYLSWVNPSLAGGHTLQE
jgi:hypothetical protein